MYYYRISDLRPARNSGDGYTYPDNSGIKYSVGISTIDYHVLYAESFDEIEPTASTNWDLRFKEKFEYYSEEHLVLSAITSEISSDTDPIGIYFNSGGIWLEGSLALNMDNKPTSNRKKIHSYTTRRFNLYSLLNSPDFVNTEQIKGIYGEFNSGEIYSIKVLPGGCDSGRGFTNVVKSETTIGNFKYIKANTNKFTGDVLVERNFTVAPGNWAYKDDAGAIQIDRSDAKTGGKAYIIAAATYWADLAEMYSGSSNEQYPPGSLIEFGADDNNQDNIAQEIRLATAIPNGVISEKPAITLNYAGSQPNKNPIVLSGRTKVRITGPIEKFDRVTLSSEPGVGKKQDPRFRAIAIALETNLDSSEKLVECVVRFAI